MYRCGELNSEERILTRKCFSTIQEKHRWNYFVDRVRNVLLLFFANACDVHIIFGSLDYEKELKIG